MWSARILKPPPGMCMQLSDRAHGEAAHSATTSGNPEMPVAPTKVSGWAFPFYLPLPPSGSFVFITVCVLVTACDPICP